MRELKLIVTDLDNTLLRRNKTISGYTADVLRRVQKSGVLIAFATARYFRTINEWLIPIIGIQPDIVISSNGGFAYKGFEVMYNATITPSVGNSLIRELRGFGGMVAAATDKMRYCERPIENTHASFSIPCDFSTDIDEDFHYVDVRGIDFDILDRTGNKFLELRCQRYYGELLATFVSVNAWKGEALTAVQKKLNIAKTIGFGDDSNDIDFLEACNTKVVMANAIDEVKALSDYICGDCDEDGVAKWLEENVL